MIELTYLPTNTVWACKDWLHVSYIIRESMDRELFGFSAQVFDQDGTITTIAGEDFFDAVMRADVELDKSGEVWYSLTPTEEGSKIAYDMDLINKTSKFWI